MCSVKKPGRYQTTGFFYALYWPVAQGLARLPYTQTVTGSNPVRPTNKELKKENANNKHDVAMETARSWRRLNGMEITSPIEDEIENVLAAGNGDGNALKVCIGTDSQKKGKIVEFATVIVFLRKGKGGFMYILNDTSSRRMSIKERMLAEVGKSIEVAYSLCHLFTKYGVDMEVHADINTNPAFKSNDALKEAMGYITGMGFQFRAKPHAFASTSCANKIVH